MRRLRFAALGRGSGCELVGLCYCGSGAQSRFACLVAAADFPLAESPLFMKFVSRSMGSGKMMVEFFSAEMEFSV